MISLRHKRGYQLGQIANADTTVYFDARQHDRRSEGTKQVRVLSTGNEKTRLTAMLCRTADGHKLPSFPILKQKTQPNAVTFPPGVIARANEKGWVDTDIVLHWIDYV